MAHTTDPDFLKLNNFFSFFFTKVCIFLLQKMRSTQSNIPKKKHGTEWVCCAALIPEFHSLDTLSLIQLLETSRFQNACFLFTIYFQSLYTNIPVEDAVECIIKLVEEYGNVIPTANLILEILKVMLKNSVITFDGEYFNKLFESLWVQTLLLSSRIVHGWVGIQC